MHEEATLEQPTPPLHETAPGPLPGKDVGLAWSTDPGGRDGDLPGTLLRPGPSLPGSVAVVQQPRCVGAHHLEEKQRSER